MTAIKRDTYHLLRQEPGAHVARCGHDIHFMWTWRTGRLERVRRANPLHWTRSIGQASCHRCMYSMLKESKSVMGLHRARLHRIERRWNSMGWPGFALAWLGLK